MLPSQHRDSSTVVLVRRYRPFEIADPRRDYSDGAIGVGHVPVERASIIPFLFDLVHPFVTRIPAPATRKSRDFDNFATLNLIFLNFIIKMTNYLRAQLSYTNPSRISTH